MSWIAVAVVGSAVVGGVVAKEGAEDNADAIRDTNAAQIEANKVDPRITAMLFGNGTQRLNPGVAPTWSAPDANGAQTSTNPQSDYTSDTGLLGQYTQAMNKPQDWALGNYANNARNYITDNAGDMGTIRGGALQQMQGLQAPQMDAPLMMNVPLADQVKLDLSGMNNLPGANTTVKQAAPVAGIAVSGPSQDKMDLSGSFDRIINGPLGANPYLTGAIQKGINQSKNAFDMMQDDSSRNMREYILPSVRGGAIASGQYGGSRQGIAEGRAMGDFAREQQRAISQFGQNNTDAAVSAQAAAYNSDSDRALSATQGLSGQQYGSAIASAQNAQSAANATAANEAAANMLNAQLQQQRYLQSSNNALSAAGTQAGLTQQTNLANQNALLGVGQNNQQSQLGTNSNNLNALMGTNTLNSQNLQNGMANLGGLLNSNFGTAAGQDQYDMTKIGNGLGVLAPYLAKNATPTQLQPVYNNGGAAALGGALAGAQIGGNLYNSFGGSGTGNPTLKGGSNGYGTGAAAGGGGTFYDGYGWGS